MTDLEVAVGESTCGAMFGTCGANQTVGPGGGEPLLKLWRNMDETQLVFRSCFVLTQSDIFCYFHGDIYI